jgi:hypothetical protein
MRNDAGGLWSGSMQPYQLSAGVVFAVASYYLCVSFRLHFFAMLKNIKQWIDKLGDALTPEPTTPH